MAATSVSLKDYGEAMSRNKGSAIKTNDSNDWNPNDLDFAILQRDPDHCQDDSVIHVADTSACGGLIYERFLHLSLTRTVNGVSDVTIFVGTKDGNPAGLLIHTGQGQLDGNASPCGMSGNTVFSADQIQNQAYMAATMVRNSR